MKKLKIILSSVSVLLTAIFVAGNIVLSTYAPLIHEFFAANFGGGEITNTDGEHGETALVKGDELVRKIGDESFVLMKNNGTLPIKEEDFQKVNLFGWNSTDAGFLLTGGGAGGTTVKEEKKMTLIGAFKEANIEVNQEIINMYEKYSTYDADANDGSAESILVNPPVNSTYYSEQLMNNAISFSNNAIITLSRFGKENGGEIPFVQNKQGAGLSSLSDNTRTYLQLSTEEEALIDLVSEKFENVIVLINSAFQMELGKLDNPKIDAVINVGYTGQTAVAAVPRIITGKVNPSGRLANTWAYDGRNNSATYPNATGKNRNISYVENIYVGYKWYETAAVEGYFNNVSNEFGEGYDGVVQYPFGHGLSYTSFSYDVEWPDLSKMTKTSSHEVKVKVTNTGSRPGKDVIQLYYTPEYYEGGLEKAAVNLLAFTKTNLIEVGKSETVTLKFTAYDMASYDCYGKAIDPVISGGYIFERGNYQLSLRSDSHNILDSKICNKPTLDFVKNSSIIFNRDLKTNTIVKNLFTYEDAYAGVPIDGTTVYNNITYLSRSDFKSTFPKTIGLPDNDKLVTEANNYQYEGYDNDSKIAQEVANYKYGEENNLRLITKADGSFATMDQLSGNDKTGLIYNIDLLTELADYNNSKWTPLLNQISETEVKQLIGGGGYGTLPIESVGLPRIRSCDGSSGFSQGIFTGAGASDSATSYPCEAIVACSWNIDLAYDIGRLQGFEASTTSIRGWYAPGLNLHRSPYNSRNFEYYSEDAVLTGFLGSEVIRGSKNYNVYCYMKHFAASEAGNNPSNWKTWLTEQALRELYLKPFERCAKEGGANAVMTAFSCVGAVYSGHNWALCTQILRNEWGFRGSIITDYYGQGTYMNDTKCVLAGNDLMLDPLRHKGNLDLTNNAVAFASRRSVKNILYTFIDTYVTANKYQESLKDNDLSIDLDGIIVEKAAFSPLFVTLWVGVDVLLAAAVALCLIFILKKTKGSLNVINGDGTIAIDNNNIDEKQHNDDDLKTKSKEVKSQQIEKCDLLIDKINSQISELKIIKETIEKLKKDLSDK